MKKSFTLAIMACTALATITAPANAAVTILSSFGVANADPLSSDNADAMQDKCDLQASTHDTGNGDIWTGEVVLGAITLQSGPIEVAPLHDIDDAIAGTLHPASGATFTPNNPHIVGDPYRNGGSVNMFGTQASGGGHWSASQYDFYHDFSSTFRHAFSCTIKKAVFHSGLTTNGSYIIDPNRDPGLSNDAVQNECNAYNKRGQHLPLPGYWGNSPQGHCVFVPGDSIPDYWDPPVFVSTDGPYYVDQDQTDSLKAHESNGEGYDTPDDITRQVVVCISPSKTGTKLPGSWVQQNGYTGSLCTSPWYYGTSPYSLAHYAGTGVANLNNDSHNWVTIP